MTSHRPFAIEAHGLGKAFRLARRPANGALLERIAGVISRNGSSEDDGRSR